jgi:hypothetical protein
MPMFAHYCELLKDDFANFKNLGSNSDVPSQQHGSSLKRPE